MLSFEEKLAIADSFPELERKNVSMKRVNYHYEESMFDKKTVVYHLHPNGNGFVYADQMWYIFAGEDLDTVFESYEEAVEYLTEEGFARAAN